MPAKAVDETHVSVGGIVIKAPNQRLEPPAAKQFVEAAIDEVRANAWTSKILGFVALCLASVNIFGGFLVTQRMLSMYKKKEKK
ncbi:MAG: proton-translocating transhydrogenase family protein [Alphaproteobacteria bacterium]